MKQFADVSGADRMQARPPEDIAEILVRAIEKNKLRVVAGWEAYAADWLKRRLPIRTHKLIAHRMQKGVGP